MLKPQKLSLEEKQKLEQLGMTEYKGRKLSDVFNPSTRTYWVVHGSLLTGAVVHRLYLRKFSVAPFLFSSAMIFACSYSMLSDLYKYDFLHMTIPWRPLKLQDHLESSPITRNAYEKAMRENQEYQRKLKQKIRELEDQE